MCIYIIEYRETDMYIYNVRFMIPNRNIVLQGLYTYTPAAAATATEVTPETITNIDKARVCII